MYSTVQNRSVYLKKKRTWSSLPFSSLNNGEKELNITRKLLIFALFSSALLISCTVSKKTKTPTILTYSEPKTETSWRAAKQIITIHHCFTIFFTLWRWFCWVCYVIILQLRVAFVFRAAQTSRNAPQRTISNWDPRKLSRTNYFNNKSTGINRWFQL